MDEPKTVTRESTLDAQVSDGSITIDGDAAGFGDFLGLLDTFELWFNNVTP